ncbi:hypothetical protein BVRB_5g115740 [Beta vulgaris subsp. vulgaris]|nr:hypothetical protein BVRB_5g115740 [Beta vulgaris subsp. vulgaris]
MKLSMKPFAAIFLVLLLVLATEIGPRVAEARTCGTPSQRFRGLCVRKRNCESVCNSEGFPDGSCQGARRRCICNRPCAK